MTEVPGLDVAGLTAWLADAHPDLASGDLTATVIAGGRSNLTYAVDGARLPLILRHGGPTGRRLECELVVGRARHRGGAAARVAVVVAGQCDDADDDRCDDRKHGSETQRPAAEERCE